MARTALRRFLPACALLASICLVVSMGRTPAWASAGAFRGPSVGPPSLHAGHEFPGADIALVAYTRPKSEGDDVLAGSGDRCATAEAVLQHGCEDCRVLSTELCQLLRAAEPATFAVEHALFFEGGRVRAEIELSDDPDGVADAFDLRVEARYGQMLQALAPLGSLCDLANDPRVLVVRAPIPLSPGRTITAP
jgi:hypothetical protein